MFKRYCGAGRIECPQLPACGEKCHFDAASLKGRMIFITSVGQPVPGGGWYIASRLMIGAVLAVVFVFFMVMFLTGFYLWSLLV